MEVHVYQFLHEAWLFFSHGMYDHYFRLCKHIVKINFYFFKFKNKSMLNTSFEGICCFNQENCFRLFQLQKFISTLGIYYFEE